jgi:hypothetical protein
MRENLCDLGLGGDMILQTSPKKMRLISLMKNKTFCSEKNHYG